MPHGEAADLFKPSASSSKIHVDLKDLEEQRKRDGGHGTVLRLERRCTQRQRRPAPAGATLAAELHSQAGSSAGCPGSSLTCRWQPNAPRSESATLAAHPPAPEATQQRIEAEERQRAALEKQREAQAALEALRQQRAALQVRETLLPHASTIERLHQRGWQLRVHWAPATQRNGT